MPIVDQGRVDPFVLKVHKNIGHKRYCIEVRPRAGIWAPFLAAIPLCEKDHVNPGFMWGARDTPTGSGVMTMVGEKPSDDGGWWIMTAGDQANPTISYYIWCDNMPTRLMFGNNGKQPQYTVGWPT